MCARTARAMREQCHDSGLSVHDTGLSVHDTRHRVRPSALSALPLPRTRARPALAPWRSVTQPPRRTKGSDQWVKPP